MHKAVFLCAILTLLLFPATAFCKVITVDTTWSGDVVVDEDIVVPEGVTLTLTAGTTVRVAASESTKTDPEFMSPLTEIIVRGTLVADGKRGAPVTFFLAGDKNASWAGIIIDRGKGILRFSVISDAETGIYTIHGSLSLVDSLLTKNRDGIVLQGGDVVAQVRSSRVIKNEYGLLLLNGAAVDSKDTVIADNKKKDRYAFSVKEHQFVRREYQSTAGTKEAVRKYNDQILFGTTVWQGRVEVNGMVRVPEGSRLIILPGTVIEFSRIDSNHDSLGENGIMIQGMIIAKGTLEHPIIFRSAEKQRSMGDWDSINIMNSDKAQNIIEYCQIEDAYRGLHFHFSNVVVANVVLRNNYRGIQFQESIVEVTGSYFTGNKSAFQARDSEILFTGNVVSRNYAGLNLFRNSSTVRGNTIVSNSQEGLRVREGLPVVEGNLIDGNRHGLMINDAVYGAFDRNVISHNMESGISLRVTDTIEISGNVIQANGINGINIQDSNASIQGNLISDNGERGIGVQSFQGSITGNTIVKNKLYNLGIDGATDVSARRNWWGGGDVKKSIYDKDNDPSKGRADYLPMLERPVLFSWPSLSISVDAAWHGDLAVNDSLTVEPGVDLVLSPNTRVFFSGGAGLVVKGKILARGEKNAPVSFAAAQGKETGVWGEILLDYALGSVFTNCTFQNATWALHSHFTDLKVDSCSFSNNTGGLRFTSGPIEVTRSFFSSNDIGIRAYRGKAVITGNNITSNRIGIFVREKGGGLSIRKNNLTANSDYNIRLGDFNDEDVDAINNWWGGGRSPADGIYDARTEPGIGMVRYEPYEAAPFPLDRSSGMVLDTKVSRDLSK